MITSGECGLKLGDERAARWRGGKQIKSSRELRRERYGAARRSHPHWRVAQVAAESIVRKTGGSEQHPYDCTRRNSRAARLSFIRRWRTKDNQAAAATSEAKCREMPAQGQADRRDALLARISFWGATRAAQTRAARAPDAMPALVDAPPAQAYWRDGSAEDARRSHHPWPWWAE
jgi:hypothetical protein